jgi:hypothetical protein
MFLYKIDKKTGKKYRITVPHWDVPMPINNAIAPVGSGLDASFGSHPAFPILTGTAVASGNTLNVSWSWTFFNPPFWHIVFSTDNGSTWTKAQSVTGTTYTFSGSPAGPGVLATGTWVTVIASATGPIGTYTLTGRSNVIVST